MKNLFLVLLLPVIILFSCSADTEKVTLEPGTPSYVFAKDLATVLPAVDPDSNKVIIQTETFAISTGEVIELIRTNFGPRAGDLQKMKADRIKSIIEMNAEKIAEQKLILNAAEKKGISISEAQVDSLLQVQYQHVGGEEVFLNFLAKNGMSIEYVKKDIADAYIMKKYMDSVLMDESGISEKELQDKYRQLIQKDRTTSVQHILLMTQGKSEQEKAAIYKKMKKIQASARTGEDFGQLAKTYSEDPGSKDKGGLYADFERGTMVKPFEDAAFSVPIGELSDIIETRYGYHILKVVDRKKESRSFEEVKTDIQNKLIKEKESDLTTLHMAKLKEESSYEKIAL
ncbi:MAG: peptidylprolyl isomerase [Calditrichia bacterium]|nr:peptidylprolyl isomerase [Calditrichia bacterium]